MREGWTYKKLGEVATFINGYPFKPSDWKDSGRKIIRIQNLNNPDAVYNYYDGDIDTKYIVSNGDVLISWSGSLGVYEWSDDEAILNQHIFKVVFNKGEINKRLFEYVVLSRINEMKTKVHGITMQHITKRDFDVIPIPVPPLSEQQRIVSELDLLSSIIEKKKAQLKEYDQLAQSIFYDMFGDPITNEKGWEVKRLGEVCTFSQGVQVDVSEQITIKKDGWNRFLRIVDYTTNNSDIRYVKIDNPKYILNKDDIAMVRYGASVGVSDCGKEGVLANNLFKIDYTKQFYDKHFLLFSFHTTYFDSFIEKVAFGAAMPALSFGVMRDFQIFLPPSLSNNPLLRR